MKNKKILTTLLVCGCVSLGSIAMAACGGGDNGDKALKDAYDAYVTATQLSGQTALSYEAWLEYIKQAPVDPSAQLKSAYNEYKNAMEAQNKTPLSYAEWSKNIKLVPTDPVEWVDYFEDLYNSYCNVLSDNAAPFEDWMNIIQDKSSEAISFLITPDGNVQFTNRKGENTVIVTPKKYVITAETEDGEPLKDVWVAVSYYNSNTYFTEEADYGVTGANGKAELVFVPTDNVSYKASLSNSIKDTVKAYPDGYELLLGNVEFDGYNATVIFRDVRNHFSYAEKTPIPYSRSMDQNGEIVTNSKNLNLSLDGGSYKYLVFSPYVKPATFDEFDDEDGSLTAKALEDARKAAVGVYKISFSSDSDVVLKWFNANIGYTQVDQDGIPTSIKQISGEGSGLDDGNQYSGGNYITIALNSEVVAGECYLGLFCEEDADVTLSVERTGDAREREQIIETVTVNENAVKAPEGNGDPILAPVTGDVEAVFNFDDGYYHLGSINGPILFVDFTNPVDRASGEVAINKIPEQEYGLGEGSFVLRVADELDPEFISHVYDFNDLVDFYSDKALVNSDGLYPVDEHVYTFLSMYKSRFLTYGNSNKASAWMLPCKYYAPADALTVSTNSITLNEDGFASHVFIAPASGWYKISYPAGIQVMTSVGSLENTDENSQSGLFYAYEQGSIISLEFTSISSSVDSRISVSIESADFEYKVAPSPNVTDYDFLPTYVTLRPYLSQTLGFTDEVTPGVYNVGFIVRGMLNLGDGEYVAIQLNDNDPVILYSEDNYFTLIEIRNPATDKITFISNTAQSLNIGVVIGKTNTLALGNNEVTITDTYSPVNYSFTVTETGWYEFTAPGGVGLSEGEYGDNTIISVYSEGDTASGKFYAVAGEYYSILISASKLPSDGKALISVSQSTAPVYQISTLVEGVEIAIVNGVGEAEFASDVTAGEYVITLAGAGLQGATVDVTVGDETVTFGPDNNYSHTFTISNPEAQTITFGNIVEGRTTVTAVYVMIAKA